MPASVLAGFHLPFLESASKSSNFPFFSLFVDNMMLFGTNHAGSLGTNGDWKIVVLESQDKRWVTIDSCTGLHSEPQGASYQSSRFSGVGCAFRPLGNQGLASKRVPQTSIRPSSGTPAAG